MTTTGVVERARRRSENAVRRFMDEERLWPADGRLLLAVSGGPDSTALLLILARLAQRRALQLSVAHFDHGLRSEEQRTAERAAVVGLCAEAGLPLLTRDGDVRSLARRRKVSIEEAARQARYEFLAEAALEAGCSTVATGHTGSDQAETVLMHILRGSGLAGLGGMTPRSPWPVAGHEGLTLVRPLLGLARQETLAYCRDSGVTPVEDESNKSTEFLRNRLRLELLPRMRELNPRVDEALVRLAEAARSDVAYLDRLAEAAIVERQPGSERLDRTVLRVWPSSLRMSALRLAWRQLVGDTQALSARHLQAMERLVLQGHTGDHLDLPRGVSAQLMREALELRLGEGKDAALPEEAVVLPVPAAVRYGPFVVSVSLTEPEVNVSAKAEVNSEAVDMGVRVRRRRSGDRFQPLGMTETKKLQDFFVDAHVPREERDRVPIFETQRGIVWLGGLRIAEWARPRPGKPTIWLTYRNA
jgi:tRNA(Ile)-lysidine synthase